MKRRRRHRPRCRPRQPPPSSSPPATVGRATSPASRRPPTPPAWSSTATASTALVRHSSPRRRSTTTALPSSLPLFRARRQRRPPRPRRARSSARPRERGARSCRSTRSAGPAIVAVTHDGAGAFAVQPQQGGVPARCAARVGHRGLVGSLPRRPRGTISAFAVTADGDWTLTVSSAARALVFDAAAGVSGAQPRRRRLQRRRRRGQPPSPMKAPGRSSYAPSPSPDRRISSTRLARSPATIEVPAGPGFVTIDAPGPWSLQPPT